MKFIFKNTHFCINMFPWLTLSNIIEKKVKFTESSKYILYDGNIISVDQEDLNKLFGFTSGIFGRIGEKLENTPKQDLPYYYTSAHWNSARFVWRYNPSTDKMEITWYIYDNGIRMYNTSDIVSIDFDKEYVMSITKNKKTYTFKIYELLAPKTAIKKVLLLNDYKLIWNKEIMVSNVISNIGKKLVLFFGGNKVAPNNIKISIKNA